MTEQSGQFRVLREIGPYTQDSLPAGLRAEHRLKAGRWARLTILRGSIRFVWDDGDNEIRTLAAGKTFLVPPERPHHLEQCGDFELTIAFLEQV